MTPHRKKLSTSRVPAVMGRIDNASAPCAKREMRECFRQSTNPMTREKQTAGVTMSTVTQAAGVANQSLVKPLVAYQTQMLAAHNNEQTRSANDKAEG